MIVSDAQVCHLPFHTAKTPATFQTINIVQLRKNVYAKKKNKIRIKCFDVDVRTVCRKSLSKPGICSFSMYSISLSLLDTAFLFERLLVDMAVT